MWFHLKIMLRNLHRGGVYSVINIGGLAVGITACILIMLWVQDEVSFDKFHKRSQDIFKTNLQVRTTGMDWWWNACAPLAFTAREEIPEIENACRFYTSWEAELFSYITEKEERSVKNFSCGMVDTTFFSIFDFQVLDGNVRITISWRIFALAGIITVALTLLTVGWQAIKAAMANPVKSIMNS